MSWLAAAVALQALWIPSSGQSIEALRAQALRQPGVVAANAVFSESERRFLIEAGQPGLAVSMSLTLSDAETLTALQRGNPLGGTIGRNPRMGLTENPEQWGLNNRGEPQEIDLSDIQARVVRSVVGEDVGLRGVPAERAGNKVIVAVLDTGVDLAHPALGGRIHRTASECEAKERYAECMRTEPDKEVCHRQFAQLDADGNGYPLDCSGWNVTGEKDARTGIAGSNDPTDDIGHGTHVAGIVAAKGFVSGIASQVEILPIKVIPRGGGQAQSHERASDGAPDPRTDEFTEHTVFSDYVARGVLYAIRSRAQILNLSLGYSLHDDSELMRRMVALAQSRGITVVAAAGNQASRQPVYPCRYPDVVCVASFNADGSVSHFSDYGDSVDIAAPGYKILSSWPTQFYPSIFTERKGYDFKSGTSMAAPFVTGALARLINAGITASDAIARLVASARPSLPPTAMPELARKFTLSGNLDLGRAFAVTPQPWIVPAIKEPVLVPLDRMRQSELRSARFQIALKNIWEAGVGVEVEIALASDLAGGTIVNGSLKRVVALWPRGESEVFEGELSFEQVGSFLEVPGDFYFEVKVTVPGLPVRTFKKSAEFFVPIRPMPGGVSVSADRSIQRIETNLNARSLQGSYSLRPVGCLDTIGTPAAGRLDDLFLTLKGSRFTTHHVLSMGTQGGRRTLNRVGGALLDPAKERAYTFSCLDLDRDGSRDYVLTFLNTTDRKYVFAYFDSQFRPVRAEGSPQGLRMEVGAETAAVPEDFRFLEGAYADRRLAPAWISRGRLPTSEAPGYNPWEVRPADAVNPQDMRLYALTSEGLRTVPAPEGYRYVGFLRPSPEELKQGSATVLLLRGSDYLTEFYTAKLERLRFSTPALLSYASSFHRLSGPTMVPVIAGNSSAVGTAFVEEGASGRMRVSLKFDASVAHSQRVRSVLLQGTKPGDVATQVLGLFGDASSEAVQAYFRSRFEMYYFDGVTGQTLSTDLKQYDEVTRHLPTRVDGVPALILPEGQGSSLTTEVILPRTLADGTRELYRSAKLKTWALDGCELINQVSTGAGFMPSRLIYFCGDHFLEVPFN